MYISCWTVDKAADIRGVTSFGQQEPFDFFQYVTARIIKGAGIKPRWGFVPASKSSRSCIQGMVFSACVLILQYTF